jgi:enamine deaminase RidA (YjgF/YER057c/UK114 family)
MRRRSIEIEGLSHLAAIPVATRIGPLLVSSVITSFDPGTRHMPATTAAQVANIYTHIGRILVEAGATWDDVAKVEFWVPSDDVRAEVDATWQEHFPDSSSRPSRHIHVSGKYVSASLMAYIGA